MNSIFKFTTLFGLLAVEIVVKLKQKYLDSHLPWTIDELHFLVTLAFVHRSFYCMKIAEAATE